MNLLNGNLILDNFIGDTQYSGRILVIETDCKLPMKSHASNVERRAQHRFQAMATTLDSSGNSAQKQ